MPSFDLNDADSPERVPGILRAAANAYRESNSDLEAAWQDQNAGKVWGKIATNLERCAHQIEKLLQAGD